MHLLDYSIIYRLLRYRQVSRCLGPDKSVDK
jgi:hypothetical protein